KNANVTPELLSLLRCPLTLQPLRLAPAELLARLPVPLDAALVREDGAIVYPIRDGIPMLLPEEAIAVESRAE
ncbi:MAG TPA: hypothetical protein VEO95_13375, partial [Chthoniobacteraceae bacterium]|nr:hypothetical protein [Chthoniobacteraceae bacterium]